jgi:hypothetical protein
MLTKIGLLEPVSCFIHWFSPASREMPLFGHSLFDHSYHTIPVTKIILHRSVYYWHNKDSILSKIIICTITVVDSFCLLDICHHISQDFTYKYPYMLRLNWWFLSTMTLVLYTELHAYKRRAEVMNFITNISSDMYI